MRQDKINFTMSRWCLFFNNSIHVPSTELLARINTSSNGSAAGPEETDGGGAEDPSGAEGGPRYRKSSSSAAAGAASASDSASEAKYTPDQQSLVRK